MPGDGPGFATCAGVGRGAWDLWGLGIGGRRSRLGVLDNPGE